MRHALRGVCPSQLIPAQVMAEQRVVARGQPWVAGSTCSQLGPKRLGVPGGNPRTSHSSFIQLILLQHLWCAGASFVNRTKSLSSWSWCSSGNKKWYTQEQILVRTHECCLFWSAQGEILWEGMYDTGKCGGEDGHIPGRIWVPGMHLTKCGSLVCPATNSRATVQ